MTMGSIIEKRPIRRTKDTTMHGTADFVCRMYRTADKKLGESSKVMACCNAPKVIDALSLSHVMARRAPLRTNNEKVIVMLISMICADWK
jgi:hypothetical protein